MFAGEWSALLNCAENDSFQLWVAQFVSCLLCMKLVCGRVRIQLVCFVFRFCTTYYTFNRCIDYVSILFFEIYLS